jgi:hypothetical protein
MSIDIVKNQLKTFERVAKAYIYPWLEGRL